VILRGDGVAMACQHMTKIGMTRQLKTEDDVDDDVITRCWLTDACDVG